MVDHGETAIDRQTISMVISMPVAFVGVGYDVGYFVGSSPACDPSDLNQATTIV